ncbi:hypothetical protein MNBD_ALPHA04-2277 [hydrothermal vent metagenome]|uniref:Phytase-like domain-containing protein n=1 Tax=hydrothermal vent metagenome TaxID=652676 RepID=A0A3B0SDP5_9ZZZZ
MRPFVIRLFACISLLFFLVPVTYVHGPQPKLNFSQYISLEPITFNVEKPNRKITGRLEFLGGWKLDSDFHSFGGFSAMLAMPDLRFLLLSDNGILAGFTLDEKNNRALRPFIARLPAGPEPENEHAMPNWDSESIVYDEETGRFWVGYERGHGIWRYGRSFARKEADFAPPIMKRWPMNGGAEAMLRIPGKGSEPARFLVFSESQEYKAGGYEALIFDGDPAEKESKPISFGYRPPKGFFITDAALLPDGRALILHRRFTPLEGISAIVSIADISRIEPGKVWTSRRIATLKKPFTVDNMEGLAVTQEGDDTIIWLVSDDNFSVFQDNILLKFRLLKGRTKPSKSSRSKKPNPENEKAEVTPGFSALPENQTKE